MDREVTVDFSGTVAVVTGVSGALGSAVARRFSEAGAAVCGVDVVPPDAEDAIIEGEDIESFFRADLTDEKAVAELVADIQNDYGRIDHLLNIAGTWQGGNPIEDTDVETFETLIDVNFRTAFLASKYALPALQESDGAIVSVSARSSLEGGAGDGIYRATKAAIRLLTETIAAENTGTVRANCVMPSVIDTPMNREMMPDADHDTWVDPSEIAAVMAVLCSDATTVTSGAAVPVYGNA